MLAFINQVFVCFVRDDNQIVIFRKLSHFFGFRTGKNYAGWILWSIEINGPSLFAKMTFKRRCKAVLPCLISRDQHWDPLAVGNQVLDRGPIRRKYQNFVAWIYHRLERSKQPLHTSVQNNYIVARSLNAVLFSKFVSYCRTEFRNTRRWRITDR